MTPVMEFRTLPVSSAEPADRTTQGTVLGVGETLDLGAVDTTDEAQDTAVRVFWLRIADMGGYSEVGEIRVWIEDADEFPGANAWRLDVTDEWTPGKTAVQVETGSPGAAPLSEETAAEVTRIGGGVITGTGHADTSQYLYLAGRIGVNEPTGTKVGPKIMVRFRYM